MTSLRPRTASAYLAQFKLYLAFVIKYRIDNIDNTASILAFLEFLVKNDVSHSQVNNYISAIKHYFKLFNLSVTQCDHPHITLFTRSLRLNASYTPTTKNVIDIPTLIQISEQCEITSHPLIFRAAFLLAYFSFLRISNFVPHTISGYDPTRHLAAGDIIFGSPGAHIIVKWEKNMQHRQASRVVQIPTLTNPSICPVSALRALLSHNKSTANAPLFATLQSGRLISLTDVKVRLALRKILLTMGLPSPYFTFHSFRRSGATLAFDSKVNMQDIKYHGGWRSDAIWRYIHSKSTAAGTVARTFQSQLP